jgi:hypothetical protein
MSATETQEFVMPKHAAIAVILTFFVTPALAAEFYIAKDPKTKECTSTGISPTARLRS